MLFTEFNAVWRNIIPEVLPQLGAVVKIELITPFFGDTEKLMQNLQPCAVVQRRDGTFQR